MFNFLSSEAEGGGFSASIWTLRVFSNMRPSIPIPVSETRIKLLLTWRLLWFRKGRLVKSFFRAWGHGR